MKKYIYIIIALQFTSYSWAQKPKSDDYKVHISRTSEKITIDGKLDENLWKQAEKAKNFYQVFPADTSYALTKTEAMLAYDDKFLYVAAICYDSLPGDYVIQSLKRDFSYPVSDAFVVILDPFEDKTNGFAFSINPYGVQREGLLANGGGGGVSTDWDNLWYSEVTRTPGAWYVEMAIPFTSLRFKEGIKQWGINFGRNDLKRNESSTWFPVPRIFNIATLNFTGKLLWDEAPKKPKYNISLIPYTSGGINQDYKKYNGPKEIYSLGIDAKVAVTSSLNLDLTVNPDFAQVEVDRQQVNLTRFSLFYPEKRLFFIENSDLFAQFGFRQIRPFFSRKIGLYQSPVDLQLKNIPIWAGARLSGKINKKWRVGLMDMQTGSDTSLRINSQNYLVAAFQRQMFKASNLAFILVNRQQTNVIDSNEDRYNRVVGLDYNLLSGNNKWTGKFFVHQSLTPGVAVDMKSNANATFLIYNTNKYFFIWNHEYVGKNYKAQTGFVPHTEWVDASKPNQKIFTMSYYRLEPEMGYRWFPKIKKITKHINSIKFDIYNDTYFDSSLKKVTDLLVKPNIIVSFQNSAEFRFELNHQYTWLMFPQFVLPNINKGLEGGVYNYSFLSTGFTTNKRKKFNANIYATYGEFYNGRRHSSGIDLSYRIQPFGIVTLNYSRDDLRFAPPLNTTTINLLGLKAELSFTRSMFFTAYMQYNTQTENTNVNCRFQWRFRPMSDFFIVYSDNYDPRFNIKNRAVIVKGVYWLNL